MVGNSRISHIRNPVDKTSTFQPHNIGQNPSMIYAYARVSTDGRIVDAQVRQLKATGAQKVWRETASGARPIASSFAGPRPARHRRHAHKAAAPTPERAVDVPAPGAL